MTTTTELLAIFRQEAADAAAPYMWPDALLYAYIDDAQKQFCRATYGIDDARSFRLVLTTGTEWYAIDQSILQILAANDATGRPVAVLTPERAQARGVFFDGSTGAVQAIVIGLEKGAVRVYPVPAAAGTITLRTQRLPRDVVAGDDFEVDPQHVLSLLYWVKKRAYETQDADGADPQKAAYNEGQWNAYCRKSMTEQGRMRRKVAVVAYGGI